MSACLLQGQNTARAWGWLKVLVRWNSCPIQVLTHLGLQGSHHQNQTSTIAGQSDFSYIEFLYISCPSCPLAPVWFIMENDLGQEGKKAAAAAAANAAAAAAAAAAPVVAPAERRSRSRKRRRRCGRGNGNSGDSAGDGSHVDCSRPEGEADAKCGSLANRATSIIIAMGWKYHDTTMRLHDAYTRKCRCMLLGLNFVI